jgi:hypothetical protein
VRRPAALVCATLLATIALTACGSSSSGLIPQTDASALGGDLTTLANALGNHQCGGVSAALENINIDIYRLPTSVDKRLRNQLLRGYTDLDNNARDQCKAATLKQAHHPPTGSTSKSESTGPTGPTGTTTGGTTTSPNGPTTGTGVTTTGPSGVVGPGGGAPAPGSGSTSSSGDSGSTSDNDGGLASG